MATPFHNTVRLDGFRIEESLLTFAIEGNVTTADVGKAVAMTANAGAVRLAADNDQIIGRVEVIENRSTGNVATVARLFSGLIPVAANSNVVVGDTVVGAGNGTVKPLLEGNAKAPNHSINVVVGLVGSTHAVVQRM